VLGRAVVYKEHTLGVMMSHNVMQVLHASGLRGAPFAPWHLEGWMYVFERDLRLAVEVDFNTYGVMYSPDYRPFGLDHLVAAP
jgi:hypothetical protein